MADSSSLEVSYVNHEYVTRLRDVLRYHLEEIALDFDRWDEPHVYGPGMYLALVTGPSVADYADPMGTNRWPVGGPRSPFDDSDGFADAARDVAYGLDGAVVIAVDGVVNRQLVRFRSVDTSPPVEYEPWMGSRHMSALDVSTRSDVIATLTLSQETGRVTTFEDGTFESVKRDSFGGRWQSQ